MSVALEGADGQLGSPAGGDGHHVHGVVHQSCFCLWGDTHHVFSPVCMHLPVLAGSLGLLASTLASTQHIHPADWLSFPTCPSSLKDDLVLQSELESQLCFVLCS